MGSPYATAPPYGLLGRRAKAMGNLEEAAVWFEAALDISRQAGMHLFVPWWVWGRADVYRLAGDRQSALAWLAEARSEAEKVGNDTVVAFTVWARGAMARAEGRIDAAETLHREGLRLRQAVGDGAGILDSLESVAGLAAIRGEAARAARLLAAATAQRTVYRCARAVPDQVVFDADLAAARAGLPDGAFEQAWIEGQRLSRADAVALAIGDVRRSAGSAASAAPADEPDTPYVPAAGSPGSASSGTASSAAGTPVETQAAATQAAAIRATHAATQAAAARATGLGQRLPGVRVAIGRLSADAAVRAQVRERLPAATFEPRPARALLLLPLLGAIAATAFVLVAVDLRWFVALGLAVVLGNLYGSLMFLTHEIGHGGVVRSRRLTTVLMYPGCAVFLFSPHLWLIWHNRSHHGHTNRPDLDPDSFGTLEHFAGLPRWHRAGARLYPGPGFLRAGFCILAAAFFTIQAQSVLWSKSRSLPGYESLRRRRAVADSGAMLAFWTAVCVATGWRGTVFVVVVPWLVGQRGGPVVRGHQPHAPPPEPHHRLPADHHGREHVPPPRPAAHALQPPRRAPPVPGHAHVERPRRPAGAAGLLRRRVPGAAPRAGPRHPPAHAPLLRRPRRPQ